SPYSEPPNFSLQAFRCLRHSASLRAQVFPPRQAIRFESPAGAESSARTSPVLSISEKAVGDSDSLSKSRNFPWRPLFCRPPEPPNTQVMDGHGNWSAPDNNQTNETIRK